MQATILFNLIFTGLQSITMIMGIVCMAKYLFSKKR